MQIQGPRLPHGVQSTPDRAQSQRTPRPIGGDTTRPNPLDSFRARASFTRISSNVFENQAGTAQIEFHDDGTVTIHSQIYGEFKGSIEGDTLVVQSERGETFSAKVVGDPTSGHFGLRHVRHGDGRPDSAGQPPQLSLAALFGDQQKDDGQPKVLDTLA